MEPSEFDQLIKSKLQEDHPLHQQEMHDSKPFVWAAIQSKKTVIIPWYYSAAVAVIICLCFSILFLKLQQQHHSEIQLLSQKVERLKNNTPPTKVMSHENIERDLLCSEVEALEQIITQLKSTPPPIINNQIVYQTDTVFLTKTEYITQYLPSSKDSNREEEDLPDPTVTPETSTNLSATSDLIYPDIKTSTNRTTNENANVKVKISAFPSH